MMLREKSGTGTKTRHGMYAEDYDMYDEEMGEVSKTTQTLLVACVGE